MTEPFAPGAPIWVDLGTTDVKGAAEFYGSLFGWKIEKFPAGVGDYWHIDTGGSDDTPDGGLLPRMHSQQPITSYIAVPSIDESATKVEKLGGKVMKLKTAVPHMGYFAICTDTEDNEFALWECNENAS